VKPAGGGFAGALLRRLTEPDYPLLAVEVRPRALGIVRVQRQRRRLELGAAVVQELPEGCIVPSLSEVNIAAPEAFQAALRAGLERAGAAGASRACLVLPDPAGRVALVPAADLAGKRAKDAAELIRFRLRKSLSFDVREARLAYHPLSAGEAVGGSIPVVAVARAVLEQYEAALAAAGLYAGLVELAGLVCQAAAVHGRPLDEDRVIVNWDDGYVSLLITRAGRLAVVRTLTLPADPVAAAADVQREVFNTLLYYRERLGGQGLAGATLRSAARPPDEAAALLAEALELVPEPLAPWSLLPHGAPSGPRAYDVPAGLASTLAAVLGRAA